MNIGYTPRYSEIIKGLKQSSEIKDQHNKLIFTYPILCEKSVVSNLNTIRKFISVSVLKELIINNSINIIKLSSYVPGYGENEKNIDAQEVMINSMKGLNPLTNTQTLSDLRMNMYNDSDITQRKFDLQKKIDEKTAYIQQYLDADPKFKSLLPFIEIITLNNFINVPVIVGTKGYPMHQVPLFLILLGSLGTGLPLNTPENISNIINEYKKYKSEEFWKILNTLESKQPTKSIFASILENKKIQTIINSSKIYGKFVLKRLKRYDHDIRDKVNTVVPHLWGVIKSVFLFGVGIILYNNFKSILAAQKKSLITVNKINTTSGKVENIRGENEETTKGDILLSQLTINDMYTPVESIAIYETGMDKIKESIIIWDKVLNPNTIKQEYGIDFSSEKQSTTVFTKHLPNYDSKVPVFKKIAVDDIPSNIIGLSLRSMYNIVSEEVFNINTTYAKLIDAFVSKYSEKIDIINNTIKSAIGQMGSQTPSQIIDTINNIKKIQKLNIDDMVSLNNTIYQDIYKNQIYTSDFEFNEYQKFLLILDKTSSKITVKTNYYFNFIENILGKSNTATIRDLLKKSIRECVDGYFKTIVDSPTFDSFNTHLYRCFQREQSTATSPYILSGDKFKKYYNDLIQEFDEYISDVLEFTFAMGFISLLVDYMNYIEADIRAFDSDVTSEYNYTLIIPLDMVLSLNAIIAAKTFKNIIQNKQYNEYSRINISNNYIKGMIKYIYNTIRVPNLFVIDKKSNTVYYKMMYQSDISKISLSTMETFISSSTKVTLSNNSSSSNNYYL